MSIELIINTDNKTKVITNPDEEDIIKAIFEIEVLRTNGDELASAILERSEMTYMQTDAVNLEHQEGSLDYHYHCPNGFVSADLTASLFVSYANGDDWWKTAVKWKDGMYYGESH